MKNPGMIVAAVVAVLLLLFLVRIVFGLLQGAANFVLGLLVVAVLIGIVVWMFSYAKRHK